MRARKRPLEPRKRAAFVVAVAILPVVAPGCEPNRVHDVTIVDGTATTRFSTRSAFAEYVELPGVHNELRITLANYPVSCEHWAAPKDGDVALSLTIVTPAGAPPTPGTFAWTGIPAPDEAVHQPYALPKALLGPRSHVFEPGGSMRLVAVALEQHQWVTGVLAFEYPGDGNRPASRIDGSFEAKICRSAVAAH